MSKIWKQVCFFILIVACLFNIITKITTKISFSDEMKISSEYIRDINSKEENISNKVEK